MKHESCITLLMACFFGQSFLASVKVRCWAINRCVEDDEQSVGQGIACIPAIGFQVLSCASKGAYRNCNLFHLQAKVDRSPEFLKGKQNVPATAGTSTLPKRTCTLHGFMSRVE